MVCLSLFYRYFFVQCIHFMAPWYHILLALYEGNPLVTHNGPVAEWGTSMLQILSSPLGYWSFVGDDQWITSQRASSLVKSFDVFFVVNMSKPLNKQPGCWWFESPWYMWLHSRSDTPHCFANISCLSNEAWWNGSYFILPSTAHGISSLLFSHMAHMIWSRLT